jgi:hypothetical protein
MTARRNGRHLDAKALTEGSPRPFNPDHMVSLFALNGIGLVLIFVGWWQGSGVTPDHDQLAWLNLSLLGLLVAGAANGVWLARGRRVIGLARSAVLPYPSSLMPLPAVSTNGNGHRPRTTRSPGLVASPAMTWYHRSDCLLVVGKDGRAADRDAHQQAGRQACEVCRP